MPHDNRRDGYVKAAWEPQELAGAAEDFAIRIGDPPDYRDDFPEPIVVDDPPPPRVD